MMIGEIHRAVVATPQMVFHEVIASSCTKVNLVFGLYVVTLAYCAYHLYKAVPFAWHTSFGLDDRLKLVRCKLFLENQDRTTLQQCRSLLSSIKPCEDKVKVSFRLARAYITQNVPDAALKVAQELPLRFQMECAKLLYKNNMLSAFACLAEQCVLQYSNQRQIGPFEWDNLLWLIENIPLQLRESACREAARLVNIPTSISVRMERFQGLMNCWKKWQIQETLPILAEPSDDMSVADCIFMHLSLASIYHHAGEVNLAQTELTRGEEIFSEQATALVRAQNLSLYATVKLAIAPDASAEISNTVRQITDCLNQEHLQPSYGKLVAYENISDAFKQIGQTQAADVISQRARTILGLILQGDLDDPQLSLSNKLYVYLLIKNGLLDLGHTLRAGLLMQERLSGIAELPHNSDEKIELLRLVYFGCFKHLKPVALQVVNELEKIYDSLYGSDIKEQLGIEILGFYNDLNKGSGVESVFFKKYFDDSITITNFSRRFQNLDAFTEAQQIIWLKNAETWLPQISSSHYEQAVALLANAYLRVDQGKSVQLLKCYEEYHAKRHLGHVYAGIIALGAMHFLSQRH